MEPNRCSAQRLEHVVAEAELESFHALAAELACPAFCDAQDFSDFLQCHALHVVQGDRDALLFWKAGYGMSHFAFEFFSTQG